VFLFYLFNIATRKKKKRELRNNIITGISSRKLDTIQIENMIGSSVPLSKANKKNEKNYSSCIRLFVFA